MSTINAGNIYLYYATGRMIIGDDVKMTLRTAGTNATIAKYLHSKWSV